MKPNNRLKAEMPLQMCPTVLFNFLDMPWLAQRQIQEVDYGTFMDMAAKQELGQTQFTPPRRTLLFSIVYIALSVFRIND